MLTTLKRAFLVGVLAASSILGLAPAAVHAAGPPSLTVVLPAPGSVSVNQVFNVTVNMNTNSTPITGWQFGLTYDSTVVQLLNGSGTALTAGNNLPGPATFGNPSFLDSFPAPNGSTGGVAMKLTALGTVQFGGQALSGQDPGTGSNGASPPPLATFQFKALANGTSPFTITSLKVTDVNAAAITGVTITPANPSIQVGAVNAPNLVISNVVVASPASPADATFNVSFTVTNTGTQASTAQTATLTPSSSGTPATPDATPASVALTVPTLAAGGGTVNLTTVANGGPFTLASGKTQASVSVAVPTASNTPQTGTFQHASLQATGTTQVDATYSPTITLTPPSDITTFVLAPNVQNQATSTTPMVVKANISSFVVSVSGTNNGFMSESADHGLTYVAGGKKLSTPLMLSQVPTPATGNTGTTGFQTITGTPTSVATGTLAGQSSGNGATWATTFQQFVGFNDPSLQNTTYHETVTFTAIGTF